MISVYPTNMLLIDAHLTLTANIWWYVLAAVAAAGFAWLIYRYTLPPVSQIRKTILWILRGVALCLLILLLFEPVLAYFLRQQKQPVVILMIDRSASMALSQAGNARSQIVAELLRTPAFRDMEKRADVRAFVFADTVEAWPLDSLGAVMYQGVGTDPAGAWSRAQRVLSTENVSAIALISDGAYNRGENPIRAAAASTVPIFTLGMGDTTFKADAVIADILTNEVTYKGNRVPVDIRVRGAGLKGKATTLHLLGRNGVELGSRPVRFDDETADVSVSMDFEAVEVGDMRVIAVLDAIENEAILDNNRRSAVIKILDRKTRVLLFAGAPGADVTILRQTLEKDTTLDVVAFVERAGGGMLQRRSLPGYEDLSAANLIVLANFPTRSTPSTLAEQLARVIAERNIPVLFLAGPDIPGSALNMLREALPIKMLKPMLSEQRVVTRSSASHPAVSSANPFSVEWSSLPPLLGDIGNFAVEPAVQTAVKLSREGLGINEDEPGLVFWDIAS